MSKLYIFEGPDCSGKSTALNSMYEYLKAQNIKVIKTKEPGGTEIGNKIRGLLLDKDNEMSKLTEAYLFAASRAEHNLKIAKYLEDGYIVLCDRHFISSYVYQGTIARKVNKSAMKVLRPYTKDIKVLYFKVSAEIALERMNTRSETRDRMELSITKESYKELIASYDKLANEYKAHIINGNKSPEKVLDAVKNIIILN